MKIVFAGTPDFAVPSLKALLASEHQIVAVYTQPDRAAGRGRKLTASPVKQVALAHGIVVHQPESLRSPDEQACLRALGADLLVVVAYGLILPKAVLEIPHRGCINVHASLLPRWRGAAPIQRSIMAGDSETGVTIMLIEPKLDSGPMLRKASCPILPLETSAELHDRLAILGAEALRECLPGLESGTLPAEVQDETQVTYAAKLEKQEAILDWSQSAGELERRVRAFNPWPVAETACRDKTLRIWRAQALEESGKAEAGTVLACDKTLDVQTGQGILRLLEVQMPGGNRVSAQAFLNAHDLRRVRLGVAT